MAEKEGECLPSRANFGETILFSAENRDRLFQIDRHQLPQKSEMRGPNRKHRKPAVRLGFLHLRFLGI
jgi:hypothetical protein